MDRTEYDAIVADVIARIEDFIASGEDEGMRPSHLVDDAINPTDHPALFGEGNRYNLGLVEFVREDVRIAFDEPVRTTTAAPIDVDADAANCTHA